MYFPKVLHCLICEVARPEAGGKLTLLGFYGIVPDAEILFANLAGPFPLTFVFSTEKAAQDGNPLVVITLRDPEGATLATTEGSRLLVNLKKDSRAIVGASFNVKLPREGEYKISLSTDGKNGFEGIVVIRLSSPPAA